MEDEFKLRKNVEMATRAKTFLEDEAVKAAFDTIERQYIEAWRLTHFKDVEGREALWRGLQALGKFKDNLVLAITNGKLSKAQLDATRENKAA